MPNPVYAPTEIYDLLTHFVDNIFKRVCALFFSRLNSFKYCNVTIIILFNISHLFAHSYWFEEFFHITDNSLKHQLFVYIKLDDQTVIFDREIGLCKEPPLCARVYQRAIARRGTIYFPNFHLYLQIVYCYIPDTHWGTGLTPLPRCNWYILQYWETEFENSWGCSSEQDYKRGAKSGTTTKMEVDDKKIWWQKKERLTKMGGCLGLWHIKTFRLFNARSIFIRIIRSISNNLV